MKTPRHHLRANRVRVVGAVAVIVAFWLSGCIDPNSQFATTPPVDEFVVETEPLPDDAVEEEVIVEDIVYASVEECLQGNWEVNNEAFGEFFARTDERVVSIAVSGLATMAIEGDTYRMFFEEWSIQYDTDDPTFLLARAGNETVQFSITPDGAMEFLEQDDQIVLEFFSIVDGGDGEAIAIATSEPGPLPLDGSTLRCTGASLEVFVEQESFFFDRR